MTEETSSLANEIIADYIRSEEAGQPPDRDELIARHPTIADQLREFFADREAFLRLSSSRSGEPARRQFIPPRVRYFGNYELLEEIARGGTGVVYKAKQTSLNRIVALKLLLAGHLASREDIRRFEVEARAAAKLQHPHIVAIHEVGKFEGRHYLSMSYVEGRTLAELTSEGPLTPQRAARYVRQAAVAIDYAHREGILHRDLKPSNILIDQDDQVRITDFGLAGPVEGGSSLTRTGQSLGTPGYMPPEQAAGRKALAGPSSDVYGLGAVLYTLLTGRPPFQADSPAQVLQQVMRADPESPRSVNPRVSKDLETICLKCLDKEPHRRYGTAGLLADDLARHLANRPIAARPLTRAARSWRWYRRNPVLAGLSTTAMLLLAVLSATLVSTIMTPSRDPNRHPEAVPDMSLAVAGAADPLPAVLELREFRGFHAHPGGTVPLTLSPDGSLLATGSEEDIPGVVRLWEVTSGRLAGELLGHAGGIYGLAFSPDGRLLATGSLDETLRLWDVAERKLLRVIDNTAAWRELQFSTDGRTLFAGAHNRGPYLRAWDVESGELIDTLDAPSELTGLSVAPDGRSLVAGYRQADKEFTLEIVSLPLGGERTPIAGRSVGIEAVAYSPDGRWLATGGEDGTATLWDPQTGRSIWLLRDHPHRIKDFAFSPDNSLVAVLSEIREQAPAAEIHLWDTRSGQRVAVATQDGAGSSIAFTPAGDALISGDRRGRIRVWQLFKNRQPYGGQKSLVGLGQRIQASQAVAPLDLLAEAAGEGAHRFGQLAPADRVWRWGWGLSIERSIERSGREPAEFLAITADGQHVLSAGGDGVLQTAELASGREIDVRRLPSGASSGPVAVSDDGRSFVVPTGRPGELDLYDLNTGDKLRSLQPASFRPEHLSFTLDAQFLLACGKGEGARAAAWDVTSGEQLYSVPISAESRWLNISPDGRYFAIAEDGQELSLREVRSGRIVHRLPHSGVIAAAFSPDGRRLLTCPRDAGTLRLWELQTGREVNRLAWPYRGATATVWLIGDRAVIASEGSLLRLVNLETGDVLCRIEGPPHAAEHIAATPDRRRIISAGAVRGEEGETRSASEAALRLYRVDDPPAAKNREHFLPALQTMPDGKTFWTGLRWPTGAELRYVPATKRVRFEANGSEYQRIDVYGFPWHEAVVLCELLGGHLATITSAEENQFLEQNFPQDRVVWLGGTDQQSEGDWRWVTGEPFTFQNWAVNEPSGVRGSPLKLAEHYLDMRRGSKWNDRDASGRHGLVAFLVPLCEWDAPQTGGGDPPVDTELPPAPEVGQDEDMLDGAQAAAGLGVGETLQEMRRQFLTMAALGRLSGHEIQPVEQPLYRFADETHNIRDGSLWAWGGQGRPAALAALERYESSWSCRLVSLAAEPDGPAVVAEDGWRWAPSQPGIRFVGLEGPPAGASSAEQRLASMIEMAGRFEVVHTNERGPPQALQLRSEPLHRFANPDEGLLDGAIFAFAASRNPEVLLVLECRHGTKATDWRYAFAPLTSAMAEVRLSGNRVWRKPAGPSHPKPQDMYTLFNSGIIATPDRAAGKQRQGIFRDIRSHAIRIEGLEVQTEDQDRNRRQGTIRYRLVNTTGADVPVPLVNASSGDMPAPRTTFARRRARLLGVRLHWVERLDGDHTIANMPRNTRQQGRMYSIDAGWIALPEGTVMPAGQEIPVMTSLAPSGFRLPTGKYRLYVQYKSVSTGAVLDTATAEFDIP